MSFDQYANQDPQQIYSQLSPEQRSTIAQQFIQGYQREGGSGAQQFASLDPKNVSPQQLAQMHQDARQNHPGILGEVMKHPVASAALGGFAAYELHKHLGENQQQQQHH